MYDTYYIWYPSPSDESFILKVGKYVLSARIQAEYQYCYE